MTAATEYAEITAAVRDLLQARSPMPAVRQRLNDRTGYDDDLWKAVTEMGLTGLLVPEALGGGGAGMAALGAVLEEMGRSLPRIPFLATAGLAVPALLAAGGAAARDLLGRICADGLTASLATAEPGRTWAAGDIVSTAERHPGGYRISGTKAYVLDGADADMLIVSARLDGTLRLFAVDRDDAGVTAAPLAALDLTRPMAELTFAGADAALLGDDQGLLGDDQGQGAGTGEASALDRALGTSRVALAFEQVGGALRCVQMSVEYARDRDQFGRKIGSFQAIKHICADMYSAAEVAKASARHAAQTIDAGAEFAARACYLAKIVASESYSFVTGQNIQVHGGMGFTWEHDAHLYFRRARSSALYLGSPEDCKQQLAIELGI
jgi:alkylation response protein AidB-like acyl-CoA dehydrogenase